MQEHGPDITIARRLIRDVVDLAIILYPVALLNAGQPDPSTVLTATEEYNER